MSKHSRKLNKWFGLLGFFAGVIFAWLFPAKAMQWMPLIGMGIGLTFYLNFFQTRIFYQESRSDFPSSGWYQFLTIISWTLVGMGIVAAFYYIQWFKTLH